VRNLVSRATRGRKSPVQNGNVTPAVHPANAMARTRHSQGTDAVRGASEVVAVDVLEEEERAWRKLKSMPDKADEAVHLQG